MNKSIREAVRLVNSNIKFVVIVGILSSRSLFLNMPDLFWVSFILSLCVEVVIFSKFVSVINGSQFEGYANAFKRNFINYFLVYIILGASIVTLTLLANQLEMEATTFNVVNSGIKTIIIMLTVFVIPIVFIKQEHILSILSGISYLFSNFRSSQIILSFALLIFFIETSAIIFISLSLVKVSLLIPYAVIINIFDTYIQFIIFVMAAMALLNKPNNSLNQTGAKTAPPG